MKTLKLTCDPWNPDPATISRAAEILKNGGLAAFPTETVYGLGANALDAEAVKKIFLAKGRPADNPLILHLSRPEQAEDFAYLDERARSLMGEFWPGPLTLVCRARSVIPMETRGGLETAALRMPDHPVASALIEAAGFPVAAPSANVSGRPSPTTARSVLEDMDGRIDMILDGGDVDVGIESTVIDVSGDRPLLLRPGGMPREALEKFLGVSLGAPDPESGRRSPGTRYRHYAPSIPVRIWYPEEPGKNYNLIKCKREHEKEKDMSEWGFIGMSLPPADFGRVLRFESLKNYARGLFAGFRLFETLSLRGIVAEWPPSEGVGLGLRDRISRAAQLE